MQPLGHSSNSTHLGKCQEIGSKCVIWDGPDINCLGINLCKGQSIEVVVYHAAMKLCEILDLLDISAVQLSCLTPFDPNNPGSILPTPQTPNELYQIIIDRLCEINADVIALQNNTTAPVVVPLPDCVQPGCPPNITLQYEIPDPNNPTGPPITIVGLPLIDPVTNTSPIAQYMTTVLCELLCRMSNAESAISDLQDDVTNILNTISSSLPPVTVPSCISSGPQPMLLVDPNDSTQGAVPLIANLLCDIYAVTGPTNLYPVNTSCEGTDFASLPVVGIYPGQGITTLGQLGAISNPQTINETLNNMLIALCDLRNFANKVNTSCCPSTCLLITNGPTGIGAVIPNSPPGNRNFVRFFLNGTFVDAVTNNTVTADFANAFTDFAVSAPPPPGYAVGGPTLTPPQWDIDKPITITFDDGVTTWTPPATYTLQDFATPGFFVDFNVGANGLDTALPYTVSFSVVIEAPDFTSCTYTNSTVLSTTCDNQPVAGVFMTEVGANGFTVNLVAPLPNPTSPTVLTNFNIRIVETTNPNNEFTYTVDPAFNQYYLYPDIESYPGLTPPDDTSANWISTTDIDEVTTYNVYVQAVYDCGFSIEIAAPSTVTTLVGIEIEIPELPEADNCILTGGTLTLIPTIVSGQLLSANFTLPIVFDGVNPVTKVVSCSPGVQFGYSFETMSINNILFATGAPTNCNAVGTTRCYGQHSAAYFYPGHSYTTFLANTPNRNGVTGLIRDFDKVGCYDFVSSNFTLSSNLVNTAPPLVTNINDGTGTPYNDTEHGSYQYTYNTPTNTVVTAPTNGTNGTFVIANSLHKINNGLSRPQIIIKIDDIPNNYLNNQSVMWYGTNQGGAGSAQSVEGVQWILGVQNMFLQNGVNIGSYAGTTVPYKWVANDPLAPFAGTNGIPLALPVFMRIAHYRWNGSGYITPQIPTNTLNAVNVYDITPPWLGLPNIATTGFNINLASYGVNIGLRDKLVISFSGGVSNPGTNSFYPIVGASIPNSTIVRSSVTIEQNPFAGIFPDPPISTGPFSITGASPLTTAAASTVVYSGGTVNAISGWSAGSAGIYFGVPLNDFAPGGSLSAIAANYRQSCEFVISADTTITWSVG